MVRFEFILARGETHEFRRGQHLAFAVLSLATLCAAALDGWRRVEWLGGSWPWDGADMLRFHAIPFLPVVVLAWLAFVVIDTRSGVDLYAPNWWKVGWQPWLIFAGIVALIVAAPHVASYYAVVEVAQTYYSYYYNEFFGVEWGWLIATTIVAALTEEIVFRGLLQRALEGYMRDWYAVGAQAVVFHLVHVFVYGVDPAGGLHVIAGILYGLAFMRTRSLLAPLAFHAGGNLIHAVVFTAMLR